MSKKVLILGIVAVLVVGGAATYLWIDYSQAQDWFNSAAGGPQAG